MPTPKKVNRRCPKCNTYKDCKVKFLHKGLYRVMCLDCGYLFWSMKNTGGV